MMTKSYYIFWILLSLAHAGFAYEFRVWEDVNGNQFRGRFVKELLGKMVIEDKDGNIKRVEIEDLSELDQKFARTRVPPEIDANVSRKSHQIAPRPADSPQPITMNEYQIKVELRKKNQRPFTGRLRAEIFMIAEENISGDYVLMNKTTEEFLFPLISKNVTVELKTPWVRMKIYEGGYMGNGTRIGQVYAGYLLVVSTMQGDICYTDTSLRPWIEDPEVIQNLRDLWMKGRALWLSRLFNEKGEKIPPPRPSPTTSA